MTLTTAHIVFELMLKHDLELLLCFYFSTGRIDFMEIRQSLADLGIEITKEDAEKILKRYVSLFCRCS